MDKKKLLMISYYYPPIKGMGSLRPFFFSRYLRKNGWSVHIVTTSNVLFLDTDQTFGHLAASAKEKKIRIPTLDLQTIRYIASKIFCGKGKETDDIHNRFKSKGIHKIMRSFPVNILHEGGPIFPPLGAIIGTYLIKRYNIKCLYSTYTPYTNHIFAYLLKWLHHDLTWVADFRDIPFGESKEEIFFSDFQKSLNHLIFKKADYIITISEGIREKLSKYNRNTYVIRNGIPDDALSQGQESGKRRTDTFNITYTGALYHGKRDATILFKTLKDMSLKKEIGGDFKLIYAGKQSRLWHEWAAKYGLSDNVRSFHFLGRNESLNLQREASVNIVLTWSYENEKGIITGKLYEYLAANRPILCIVNGEKDEEIENLFKEINAGLVTYNENVSSYILRSFLSERYRQWKNKGFVEQIYNQGFIKSLKYDNLTSLLENILMRG